MTDVPLEKSEPTDAAPQELVPIIALLASKVETLAKEIMAARRDDAHFKAVQAQCAFSLEVYTGIQCVAAVENGVSAQALLRTLFEAVVGAVILAKHVEMLDDFRNHGKLTALRIVQSFPQDSIFAKKLTTVRDATKAECDALYESFKTGGGNWHRMKTTASFTDAEMPDNFYQRFYGPASAVAHGEPYVVVQNLDMEGKNWEIQPRYRVWRHWSGTSQVMSLWLMLHMVERVSQVFSLGVKTESVKQEVKEFGDKQMKAALE
jgi:hypothetical protein